MTDQPIEAMLETMSLSTLAAFIVARDDMRKVPSSPPPSSSVISSAAVLGPDTEKDLSPPSSADTLPAAAPVPQAVYYRETIV